MWAVLGVAGLVVVVTGWLPASEARDVALSRGGPVLGFLVAVTVLAELSDRAGVFEVAARRCTRLARGSTLRLFLLIAVLGSVVTIGMSLDTTAVLLTPVVLSIAEQLAISPLPFALLAVWLANTASLLLPVSNLTNLLAVQRENLTTLHFAGRMVLPQLAAIAVSVGYLAIRYRRDLTGRYQHSVPSPVVDPWTFRVCAVACVLVAPGVLAGAAPWLVATPLAAAAVVIFAVRRPAALRVSLVPWRIVIFVDGLLLFVAALSRHGLDDVLAHLCGTSTTRTALTAGAASNIANNLPTYLAVENVVPHGNTEQLLGALLGTNVGPLILLWGSLATILWRERCRARGVVIGARQFAAVGLVGVPLVLGASLAALVFS